MGRERDAEVGEANAVRLAVARTFAEVSAAQGRTLQPLADDLVLIDSGLDSLCFTNIVAQLEQELGFDPFADLDDAFFPENYGAFVQLYEAAAASRS